MSRLQFALILVSIWAAAVALAWGINAVKLELALAHCTTDMECMQACLRAGKEDCE